MPCMPEEWRLHIYYMSGRIEDRCCSLSIEIFFSTSADTTKERTKKTMDSWADLRASLSLQTVYNTEEFIRVQYMYICMVKL